MKNIHTGHTPQTPTMSQFVTFGEMEEFFNKKTQQEQPDLKKVMQNQNNLKKMLQKYAKKGLILMGKDKIAPTDDNNGSES